MKLNNIFEDVIQDVKFDLLIIWKLRVLNLDQEKCIPVYPINTNCIFKLPMLSTSNIQTNEKLG